MSAALQVSVGEYTDAGRKPENQDFHAFRLPEPSLLAVKGVAAAMADGISSSPVSHIASETAVKSFLEDYYCTSEAWSVKGSAERVLKALNCWLHGLTLQGADPYDKDKGYVCTFSAVVIKHRSAHIFHVGDTRVYRLGRDGLEQLTNDHRLWVSRQRSHLSRAMGMAEQCDFDYQCVPVAAGDCFILATDGVYEWLEPEALVEQLAGAVSLARVAKALVERAYALGSTDNLSVQLLRVDALPEEAPQALNQQMDRLALPPPLEAGQLFDGYTVLRCLYRGSASVVYLAEDGESRQTVVLKTPTQTVAGDAARLERFLMEEWIARRVVSAHVLPAAPASRPRGYLYTVFAFIEGQTLAQWAADNPKPSLERVRDLIEQVARGLHAFHRTEMLHQDLRPENCIIDRHGTVKIIDFGSVYVAGLNETASREPLTYLQGTALYSAPEYFLGEPGSVRAEQFSLGVLAYFLLSGRYPYDTRVAGAKTESAQRKLRYRPLRERGVTLPGWVDDAIARAVHPLPGRRYEELFEFVHDLRQPNPQFVQRGVPPLIERNPVALWQAVAAVLALAVIYLLVSR